MSSEAILMGNLHTARGVPRVLVSILLALVPNALLYLALSHLNTLSHEAITRTMSSAAVLRVAAPERHVIQPQKPTPEEQKPRPTAEAIATVNLDAIQPRPAPIAPVPLNLAPAPRIPRVNATLPATGLPSGDDLDERPEEISIRRPSYPISARQLGQEGLVVVRILINESGAVEDAEIVESRGPDSFRQAVLDVALTWRFRPALRDGVPVPVWGVKRIRFKLED